MYKLTIKKKMLYSLLIPYIALGIVAIIVFAYIYKSSISTINSEVIGNSYGMINKVSKETDYLIEDIERLVIEISSNTKFTKILNVNKDNRTNIDNYNIALAIQELRQIKKYNNLIKNLALYYNKGDFCINVESIRSTEGLYENFNFEKTVSLNEWEAVIRKQYDEPKIISLGNRMLYIVTIPINEDLERLNVIVQIEGDGLKQIINRHTSFSEGNLYILNEVNKVVSSNKDDERPIQRLHSNAKLGKKGTTKSGLTYEKVKVDEKFYTMIQLKGEKLNLNYIWIIENYKLAQKSDYIRFAFIGVIIAFSIILFIGIYGVKINYRQIRMIMERLSNNDFDTSDNPNITEVSFINNALSNLEQKIEDQKDILIESLLRKSLYGLIEEDDNGYKVLMNTTPGFFKDESIIAIFEPVGKEEKEPKELKLNMFVVENIMREVFNYKIDFRIIAVQNWQVIVLNHTLLEEWHGIDYILDGLERTRVFLSTQLELCYTVGVSSPIVGIENFAHAYKEAIESLQEKVIMGNNRIIYYGNLENHEKGYNYDGTIHNQILNYIRIGEYNKVFEILEKLFEANFKQYQLSLEEGKLLVLDILSTLTQLAKEVKYTMQIEAIDVLKEKYTIKEMREQIETDIKGLCTYFIQGYNSTKDKKARIIKYIEDNYQDVNLNVGMVADYLELNPSYLSRFFKEQTGENLLTYINSYRIEKVKECLKTTDKTLKVIATETGFIDSAALSRAFKKYEAITPSQYKNIYNK